MLAPTRSKVLSRRRIDFIIRLLRTKQRPSPLPRLHLRLEPNENESQRPLRWSSRTFRHMMESDRTDEVDGQSMEDDELEQGFGRTDVVAIFLL